METDPRISAMSSSDNGTHQAGAPAASKRSYHPPTMVVHGRLTDLTETGMGQGKESAMANLRPVTLSNL